MPADPELVAETRAWFVRATEDLLAADLMLTATPLLPRTAMFHAQQAAEKAMKGFLTWHGRLFRKTHDLAEIGGLCVAVDPSLEALLRPAAVLTDFAWKFRYPGEPDEPSRSEAAIAINVARRVYDEIRTRLPAEVQP